MRTGFSPATYRRNIPLRKLGRQLNPFPLVQLPYHRMVNPWTMGAILHEVCHNLQNELALEDEIPRVVYRAAARRRACRRRWPRTYARWNREIFADLVGCMLGGEAFVASLMDVIGRSPEQVLAFSPHGVHPTPYLRTFLSTHLLRRMGFDADRHATTSGSGAALPDARPARRSRASMLAHRRGRGPGRGGRDLLHEVPVARATSRCAR